MNKFLKAQARRINELSLRERAAMFLSISLALVAITDGLVISPSMTERRQLATRMRQETQQLDALRARLGTGSPDNSPQGLQRAAVLAARAQLVAVDASIREQLAGRDEVARLPELLDRLLQRHAPLSMARLATVSDLPKSADSTLRWQAVDLSMTGSYADLVSYVADLEKSLPGLRWGTLEIAAASRPPALNVRLMLPEAAP